MTVRVSAGEGQYLAEAIREELAADKAIGARELQVEVIAGEVVLWGTVKNLQARQAAEKSIRNRVGVKKVVNLLQIESSGQLDGGALAQKTRSALDGNPYLSGRVIQVSEAGDSLLLDGVVESTFQREHAGAAVSQVEGVTTVINRIAVVENIIQAGGAGLATADASDPTVQAIIESYYSKLGVKPELAFKLDTTTNLAAGWRDSLYLNPPKTGGRPRVVNPETGYYEQFDFVGLGIFLIKKAFGWDKKKDKIKAKD